MFAQLKGPALVDVLKRIFFVCSRMCSVLWVQVWQGMAIAVTSATGKHESEWQPSAQSWAGIAPAAVFVNSREIKTQKPAF